MTEKQSIRSKQNLRRIVQHKGGWRLKITYPAHLKKPDSPPYLCDMWFGTRHYDNNKAKALMAAIATREQLENKYNLSPVYWSPITGLTHRVRYMEDRQRPWAGYIVSWPEKVNGLTKYRSKSFNYNINEPHTKELAYNRALKFHKEVRG